MFLAAFVVGVTFLNVHDSAFFERRATRARPSRSTGGRDARPDAGRVGGSTPTAVGLRAFRPRRCRSSPSLLRLLTPSPGPARGRERLLVGDLPLVSIPPLDDCGGVLRGVGSLGALRGYLDRGRDDGRGVQAARGLPVPRSLPISKRSLVLVVKRAARGGPVQQEATPWQEHRQ
jgi:hypothetical protein